jgi:hypothetical protein
MIGCTETDSCLTTLATYIERPKKEVVLSRRNISYETSFTGIEDRNRIAQAISWSHLKNKQHSNSLINFCHINLINGECSRNLIRNFVSLVNNIPHKILLCQGCTPSSVNQLYTLSGGQICLIH